MAQRLPPPTPWLYPELERIGSRKEQWQVLMAATSKLTTMFAVLMLCATGFLANCRAICSALDFFIYAPVHDIAGPCLI